MTNMTRTKKNTTANRKILYMCLILLMLSLCQGCSNKRTDEQELKAELNKNNNNTTGNEEIPSDTGKQHVSYTLTGASSEATISVDAEVNSYIGKMPIYEITKHDVDDVYIKNLADRVFDNGTLQYIKPYYISSQQEIDNASTWIKQILDLYEGTSHQPKQFTYELMDLARVRDNFKPENVVELPEGQYFAQSIVDNEYDNKDPYEIMSCKFVGKIDGTDWIFSSKKDEKYHHTVIYPYLQHEVLTNVINNDDTTYKNVNCSVDQGQSEMQAKEWIAKLGFQDYELIDTSKTLTLDENDLGVINGYMFTYAKSFNGIKTGYLKSSNPFGEYTTWNIYDPVDIPQEYISIYVDSYGVEQIDLLSNYELGKELSQPAELLSYDKIDEIAKTQISKSLNKVKHLDAEIHDIELKYIAVADQNFKYCFMPVWIYHMDYGYVDIPPYTYEICINAIDGTIINSRIDFDYFYNVIEE